MRAILARGLIVLVSACVVTSASQTKAQTARDYFNELYRAGGLDEKANEYVCFDDTPGIESFFIYADYSSLKDALAGTGEVEKLTKDQRELLKNGFLVVRTYNKGVADRDRDLYFKDGSSWITGEFTFDSKIKMRVRFAITPATLRYHRTVEIVKDGRYVNDEVSRYGRCEAIPETVEQTVH